MPNTIRERDWQDDWGMFEGVKEINVYEYPDTAALFFGMAREALPYWLQQYKSEKELNDNLISELSNAIGWLVVAGKEETARRISESARAHIVRLRGELKL